MSIQLTVVPRYILIGFKKALFAEADAKECLEALKSMTESRPLLVLDFGTVEELALPALRMLIRVASTAQQENGHVAIICRKEIAQFVMQQGLDRLFQCYSSLSELEPVQGADAGRASALEFLNTVLESLSHTLKIMTNTEVKPGKSYLRTEEKSFHVEIAAVAPVFSIPFNGALVIAFPEKTYVALMSKMLGIQYDALVPEIRDGAAEILNIIIGQTKIKLNEKGFGIKQTIPTVVQGKELKIQASSQRPSVIVPYTSPLGEFFLEVTTTPRSPNSP